MATNALQEKIKGPSEKGKTRSNCTRQLVIMSHGGKDERQWKCDLCGQGFSKKSSLRYHMGVHAGIKECDVCGKGFSHKSNLTQHMVVHTSVKAFKCDLCGKEFSLKSHITRHMYIHSDVKKFKCDLCGQEFSRKSFLNQHMNEHSGAKKFKCDLCGRAFSWKSCLTQHMFVHLGVKKYKCTLCGKEFFQSCHLNQHMATHSGVKEFKCDLCAKEFAQQSSLIRHMASQIHMKKQRGILFTKMSSNNSFASEYSEKKEMNEECKMDSETAILLNNKYVATDPLDIENEINEIESEAAIEVAHQESLTIDPLNTEREYSDNTTYMLKEEDNVNQNVASSLATKKCIEDAVKIDVSYMVKEEKDLHG